MAKKRDKTAEEVIEVAIKNVEVDRMGLIDLLDKMRDLIDKGATTEQSASLPMVKYMEGLIKSNEQLIKIAAILKSKKIDDDESNELTEEDKKKFFEKDEG
jgi:hypothetical protein